MALKERVNKLCDRRSRESAELDRLIEREIERVGVEVAQEVIDEVLREYNADESRKQG